MIDHNELFDDRLYFYCFINVKIISELFKILYKNTPFIISILIDNYIDVYKYNKKFLI